MGCSPPTERGPGTFLAFLTNYIAGAQAFSWSEDTSRVTRGHGKTRWEKYLGVKGKEGKKSVVVEVGIKKRFVLVFLSFS